MSAEEHRLAELHGLDAEQICWRRNKISQLSSPELFSQEYPLVASEAFISSDFDSFISPDLLVRARREQVEPYGPLLIGVDPAGKGADSTAIAWRQDHCITKTERRKGLTTMIDQSKALRTSGSLWAYRSTMRLDCRAEVRAARASHEKAPPKRGFLGLMAIATFDDHTSY